MTPLILGTAGHIDHGKTALVRALTGIDTDTLKEEKERGISINLGFAWLDLPNLPRLGVVDVPGHLRFIRTMLAGAAGVDMALLVVAADDSVMPQTREHVDILKLLHVKQGVVALNKIDLVSPEQKTKAEQDIRNLLQGSFLENAPIVPVSALTGQGLPELKAALSEAVSKLPVRNDGGLFRLPVDRSFSVAGFGTVVTGTLFSGRLRVGDEVTILPSGRKSSVRGLQIHHQKSEEAVKGQRVAVNLSNISKEEVQRGNSLCAPGYFSPTSMLDVQLVWLDSLSLPEAGTGVQFYLGTTEAAGRLYPLDEKELVQIRLAEPVAAARGDRFIVRDLGKTRTLGGGEIFDVHPQKHRRKKNVDVTELHRLASHAGTLAERLLMEVEKKKGFTRLSELCSRLTLQPDLLLKESLSLAKEKRILFFKAGQEDFFLSRRDFQAVVSDICSIIERYHHDHPLLPTGMSKGEISQRVRSLLGNMADNLFHRFWEQLLEAPLFKEVNGTLTLSTWKVALSDEQSKLRAALLTRFEEARFSPPDAAQVIKDSRHKSAAMAIDALKKEGALQSIEGMLFSATVLEEGKGLLAERLANSTGATVSELKTLFAVSRKFAIPLLNYYESKGVLLRRGDLRILA
ncbi:MAG: selenocysteine-specific translation elongation factor [Elusimicrobia bacterium RIFOXYB2_FULL_49_7]|nr:MAG: selenocysteine-specific translation elongation factor [Elusimicrobia bacterium RIFOXYB2_FULL_49_7]